MTNLNLKTVSDNAVCDLISILNDHIEARVAYDCNPRRYEDSPPDQHYLAEALSTAILAVVRAAIMPQ